MQRINAGKLAPPRAGPGVIVRPSLVDHDFGRIGLLLFALNISTKHPEGSDQSQPFGDRSNSLADPGLRKRLDDLTVTPLIFTPAEYGAYMKSETEKWATVIKAANIKAN